jgi:iron complex transport system permease protein
LSKKAALVLTIVVSLAALAIGAGIGTVYVSPGDALAIVAHKIAGAALPDGINPPIEGIVWDLRLPRVLLAFLAGASLSVSGAIMQSILKNPLASSFTLGVSSGASLGAGLVILAGVSLPFTGAFAVPVAGFAFSLLTIAAVMRFSRAVDPRLDNNTIILSGMIVSLFANAILTLLSALSKTEINRLILWQMGSFALKGWTPVLILLPVTIAGTIACVAFARELDIMTFGDDEATALGVPVRRVKKILIAITSILTGTAISFVGVIGFLDLAIPHAARRLLGPAHKSLIPFSALFGGIFMVLADLLARTIIPPLDLPVGAITAVLGAPFFAWIYLASRRKPS